MHRTLTALTLIAAILAAGTHRDLGGVPEINATREPARTERSA